MASNSDLFSGISLINACQSLTDLKTNHSMLESLDEVLRCRICFDYFSNCMMTKCSHNFCSVCIRRYMMYKAQCPTCFQEASEPELRNNRLVDEILRVYIKFREMFVSVTPSESNVKKEDVKAVQPIAIEIKNVDMKATSSKTAAEECRIKVQSHENEVSCPVCFKLVAQEKINTHLDRCLVSEENQSECNRKPLPKLVYHLMSDKDIKKRLKEHGLSTSGDKQTLIRRHKNFRVLYNANCDALNPRPLSELVKEIEIEDLQDRLETSPKKVHIHRKSDLSEIDEANDDYIKRNKSHFNALMLDIQQRQINQKNIKTEPKCYDTYDFPSSSEKSIRQNRYALDSSDSESEDEIERSRDSGKPTIKIEPLSDNDE